MVIRIAALFGLLANVAHVVDAGQVVDFQQCDRQCRFSHGFYNRSVVGERVGALGHQDSLGRHCRCSSDHGLGPQLGELEPHASIKPWDQDFWCGGFNTSLVCVLNPGSDIPTTMTLGQATSAQRTVLHCGQCSACSNLHDLRVLNATKSFITTNTTRCSTAFAKPKVLGGTQDLQALTSCLKQSGIDFSEDGRSWKSPIGRPSCMQCWTDNIMCDAVNCKLNPDCIKKFFDPDNPGTFEGCLKCDEKRCGPEFIKCAGANRRSSGIISDIQRKDDQVCKHGYYWGK